MKRRKQARRRRHGYREGYRQGKKQGINSFGTLFDGTSIIIPNYNQVEFLKTCIDSIMANTQLPFEIIVVDNASTDGTARYLKRLGGRIRYRILEKNKGFAGATNIGMMMAKGRTMLLLNNDTIVTENWLANMMSCLCSDERIGMVGPVTNYIGGGQQIEVPYRSIGEMEEFARQYNRPDPAKWQQTDRLVGFCLLFRRELWERTGYLDEGFHIGNFEDDDYNIRVRLQGYSLVNARDTFIHHFGSISMKALGNQFHQVDEGNRAFFTEKWGNASDLIHHMQEVQQLQADANEAVALRPRGAGEPGLYPVSAAVQGISGRVYWLEHGARRLVVGELSTIPVVRLAQSLLQRWPIGAPIGAAEAAAAWNRTDAEGGTGGAAVAAGPDGRLHLLEAGVRRLIASPAAAKAWGLDRKPVTAMASEQLLGRAEGPPVVAPPCLLQRL